MTPLTSTRPKLDRKAAMKGRPRQLPFVDRREQDDGGVQVTVKLKGTRWLRLFGGARDAEKTFQLDALGRQVYEACDGETEVSKIAKGFAATHKISLGEAEISVTTYLKTLISKGLIAMVVDQEESQAKIGATTR